MKLPIVNISIRYMLLGNVSSCQLEQVVRHAGVDLFRREGAFEKGFCVAAHRFSTLSQPPVAKQREALDFLVQNVFSDRDFRFDADVLNRLAAGRWMHWDSDAMDSQLDYPIHDRIAQAQWTVLFTLFNPVNLDRIYDAELKVPQDQDAMTIPEVVGKVTSAIWSEVDEGAGGKSHNSRQPYISSIRRNLQRQYLNTLLNIVLSEPGGMMSADVHSVVASRLGRLSEQIGKSLSAGGDKLDDFSRAHLDESKSRIDRALAAKYQL